VLFEKRRALLRHALLQATRESLAVEDHESPPEDDESEDEVDDAPDDEESEAVVGDAPDDESEDEADDESDDETDEDPGVRLSLPE